jgi:hypothetical protein
MATKIPLTVKGSPDNANENLGGYMVYNPVFLNFYLSLGNDFTPDTDTLGREFANWGGSYTGKRNYILFKQDEDATLFLLRFS